MYFTATLSLFESCFLVLAQHKVKAGARRSVKAAIGQHVVDGGEDRGRHGNSSFFGPASCPESKELSLKVAVLL